MEEIENNVQENIKYVREMLNPAADQSAVDYIEDVLKEMFTYIYAEKDNLEDLINKINGEE